jgi:hypothetical protein
MISGCTSHLEANSHLQPDLPENIKNSNVILSGRKLQKTFKISPTGTKPLKITSIGVSCDSCSSIQVSKRNIPPGETAEVKVIVDTSKFYGPFERTVRLLTDDPNRPSIDLTVKGIAIRPVISVPQKVVFDKVLHNQGATKEIILQPGRFPEWDGSMTGAPVIEDFNVVDCNLPKKISWLSVGEPNKAIYKEDLTYSQVTHYKIPVHLSPDAPLGRINQTIIFKTDVAGDWVVKVPVVGEIVLPIVAEPSTITFGPVKRGHQVQKQMVLKDQSGSNFEIKSIVADVPFLSVKWEKNVEKGCILCIITWKAQGPSGLMKGNVTIRTDRKTQKDLCVRVFGFVRD